MMRRLIGACFMLALAAGMVSAPARAQGESAGEKPYVIYMITFRGETLVEKGFKEYLAAQHVPTRYIMRDAKRDMKRIDGFIREAKQLKPDLVYTWGTPITLKVVGSWDKVDPEKNITDIPVLFTNVTTPVLSKVVPKFDSSGRNVTGVFHVVPFGDQMRAIQSYRPFKKIGILYNTTEKNSVVVAKRLHEISRMQNFQIIEKTFKLDKNGEPTPAGIANMIHDMKVRGADWLYYMPDTYLGKVYYLTSPAALKERLPTFGALEPAITEGGALAGIICHYYNVGQLAAYKAQQILVKKVPPEDVPIETLKRFSFLIRMPVAKQLGLYPPLPLFNYAEILTEPAKIKK